ncbi:helix-turn-helix domain-containing protein [Clostridium neonatale]|uniref:helix-turn-helix domain-containing protein n=1 Tax=Clostridium neonatale TaxID=137838 RepID=UPI00374EA945
MFLLVQFHFTTSLKIKTDNLGDKMGVTQRSINRVLKQLKENRVIDIQNSNVIVKDYELLINQRDL